MSTNTSELLNYSNLLSLGAVCDYGRFKMPKRTFNWRKLRFETFFEEHIREGVFKFTFDRCDIVVRIYFTICEEVTISSNLFSGELHVNHMTVGKLRSILKKPELIMEYFGFVVRHVLVEKKSR